MLEVFGIILAGEKCNNLWPITREQVPKQLVKINNSLTFFQSTVLRTARLINNKNLVIVANQKYEVDFQTQLRDLDLQVTHDFLLESVNKNTASAITAATLFALDKLATDSSVFQSNSQRDDAILFITPTDYSIKDADQFKLLCEKGLSLAQEDKFVTIGITADSPYGGYSFFESKGEITTGEYKIALLDKQPTKDEHLASQGKYFLNTGIYIVKASVLLNALKKHASHLIEKFENISSLKQILLENKGQLEDLSIEKALFERIDTLVMLKADNILSPMRNWASIYNSLDKNDLSTVIQGNVVDIDSKNSLIYSTGKLVTTVGLDNVTVVETEDALLICDSDRTQEISDLYEKVKSTDTEVSKVHTTMYRPWGSYTVLQEQDTHKVKILCVKPGAKLSLQMHHHRSEHWTVVSGTALVTKDDKKYTVNTGESIDLPVEVKHSVENPFQEMLKIIEVQTGSYLGEDDIVRFQDIYGRVK